MSMSHKISFIALAALLAFAAACNPQPSTNTASQNATPVATPPPTHPPPLAPPPPPPPAPTAQSGEPEATPMEVNKAVMVTEELDLGKPAPTIAQALQQIERRYRPDDGVGRTFAVPGAYGDTTPDGKLPPSTPVISETPGMAELVRKPTGRVLWRARVMPSS